MCIDKTVKATMMKKMNSLLLINKGGKSSPEVAYTISNTLNSCFVFCEIKSVASVYCCYTTELRMKISHVLYVVIFSEVLIDLIINIAVILISTNNEK